jgi:hypothetical protein
MVPQRPRFIGSPVGCGRAPESVISHRPTAPGHARADRHKSDDVLHLGGELRVVRQLEKPHTMRFQTVRPPDPLHAAMADASSLCRRRPGTVRSRGRVQEQPAKARVAGRIVLLSADRVGTMAIRRQTGKSKPTIWRWQVCERVGKGPDGRAERSRLRRGFKTGAGHT